MISKRKSQFLYIFHFEYDRMNELLVEKKLLDIDLRVYTFLCREAEEENDSCDSTKEYISEKLKKDPETIRTSINRLCEYNFIQKVEQKNSKKMSKNNVYFIIDLENCPKNVPPNPSGGETEICPKNLPPEILGWDRVLYNNIYKPYNNKYNTNMDNGHNVDIHTVDNGQMTIDDFSVFWNSYPKRRHEDKQLTKSRFLKLNKNLLPVILETLEKQKQTLEWKKDNNQFVPQPAKWLKNKRWEDEVAPMSMKEIAEQMKEEAAAKYGYDKAANIASFEFEKKYGQAEYLKLRDTVFEGE